MFYKDVARKGAMLETFILSAVQTTGERYKAYIYGNVLIDLI